MAAESGRRSPAAKIARKTLRYLFLAVMAFIVLFPIYITVVNSLLSPDRIASRPPTLFPLHPIWSGYSDAWKSGHLGEYLRNSFIVATFITAAQVATSILAGYPFAFLPFPFPTTIFILFFST